MASRVVIREATDADVGAVRRLQELWAGEGITHGFVPEDPARIKERAGVSRVLVAEADGLLVGFAAGATHVSGGTAVTPEGTPCFEVEDLYVAPDARGRGVGGLLLERLLEDAVRDGARQAVVYSASKDVRRVLKFYEGHGFSPWFVQLFRDL